MSQMWWKLLPVLFRYTPSVGVDTILWYHYFINHLYDITKSKQCCSYKDIISESK